MPRGEWLAPTKLGMMGSSLDEYAQGRYNIDTRSLITRLWTLLADAERQAITDSMQAIEALLTTAFSAAVLSATAFARICSRSIFALSRHHPVAIDVRNILFVIAPAIFAWAFYQGAIVVFRSFADRVVRSIDLNRTKLLIAMGYPLPETAGEEATYWEDLARFIVKGEPFEPSR